MSSDFGISRANLPAPVFNSSNQEQVDLSAQPRSQATPETERSGQRLATRFVTAEMIRDWLYNGPNPGIKQANAVFEAFRISDRSDQKMVSALLFLSGVNSPQISLATKQFANAVLETFLAAQSYQRATYGTSLKAEADRELQAARRGAWDFLEDTVIMDKVGGFDPIAPARTTGNAPPIYHF